MNLSTILSIIRHLPQAERLIAAADSLASTPEAVEFDAALAAYKKATGAKIGASPAAAEQPPAPSVELSGRPDGANRGGLMPPGT